MSPSSRFVISQTIVSALAAAVGVLLPPDATVHDNPAEPASLRDGPRIVFVKDEGDSLISQEGQIPRRRFTFTLGVIARTGVEGSRADADALYEAAQAVVRGLLPAIKAAGVRTPGPIRETDVSFDLEGIDVGGALILGTIEIQYEKPRV